MEGGHEAALHRARSCLGRAMGVEPAKNPEHMLIAVEYVEEFVAQSDVYPLDPADT